MGKVVDKPRFDGAFYVESTRASQLSVDEICEAMGVEYGERDDGEREPPDWLKW